VVTRVYLEQAGCDRRRLDAMSIQDFLDANGYELVDDPFNADRIIAFTCAFKEREEEHSVRRLRSLRKYQRDMLVYGCLQDIAAERYAEFGDLPALAPRDLHLIDNHFEEAAISFAQVPDANVIVTSRNGLVQLRRRLESRTLPGWHDMTDRLSFRLSMRSAALHVGRTTPPFNLFICRGCTGLCSYCAIRRSIGPVKSKSAEQVLSEFLHGLTAGHRTFTILGDDPGCYGLDRGTTLPDLLGKILEAAATWEQTAPAASRHDSPLQLHLREIHPKYLIRYESPILRLPGLPLLSILCPIQSGSDRLLQLMQREHSSGELLHVLERLREINPGMRLDTQIIVGFPTETPADLERTLEFVKRARFDSVVVFPYHAKKGTLASGLQGEITRPEIARRMRAAFRYFRSERIAAFRSCP